jgi:hypothetical protein
MTPSTQRKCASHDPLSCVTATTASASCAVLGREASRWSAA